MGYIHLSARINIYILKIKIKYIILTVNETVENDIIAIEMNEKMELHIVS